MQSTCVTVGQMKKSRCNGGSLALVRELDLKLVLLGHTVIC
jgi:hypothetical protein